MESFQVDSKIIDYVHGNTKVYAANIRGTQCCGSKRRSGAGVLADGRCLFRAIAHGACLRSGEEAPDENRQRVLADELRAQVVDELLKRREETEWFIEGDFDAYVKRIQQPYVWGGEPELLMASHVLKTMISVFMIDRASGNLVNIANYGEEYRKDEVNPINVLFHGYGHYDILETSGQSYQKVNL
ncbi:cysteine-type peptidase, putative [Ricinus communis]|uniref:Ubiquitin thioesterase OTU n=1 Tax=Ricinus communis TaxID=3988 RepID=B9SY22_RICCO|nr:cysteine-type peptidase, putative [Ricinus communis]